jgi:transcriptional regulator GlxA family with amidase domain
MPRRIVLVGFDQAQPLDVVGPFEVFASANFARRHAGAKEAPYQLSLVSPGGAPVRGESGLGLAVDGSLERVSAAPRARVDTLLVCGGRGARLSANDPKIVESVARAARGARRVASVCTGAFVLAAAGLLDDKRATTHWASCDRLARLYPRVQVETAPIYVRDGRVWTSAGVTAGIDLALAPAPQYSSLHAAVSRADRQLAGRLRGACACGDGAASARDERTQHRAGRRGVGVRYARVAAPRVCSLCRAQSSRVPGPLRSSLIPTLR